ncbi:protein of unknown function [Cupriavidus taiwanensis]|nr:protein of unknown function [Cupriavidus taiwanensis]
MEPARRPDHAARRPGGGAARRRAGIAAGGGVRHAGRPAAAVRHLQRGGAVHRGGAVRFQLARHVGADQRQLAGAVRDAEPARVRGQPGLYRPGAGGDHRGGRDAAGGGHAAAGLAGQLYFAVGAARLYLRRGDADRPVCAEGSVRPVGADRHQRLRRAAPPVRACRGHQLGRDHGRRGHAGGDALVQAAVAAPAVLAAGPARRLWRGAAAEPGRRPPRQRGRADSVGAAPLPGAGGRLAQAARPARHRRGADHRRAGPVDLDRQGGGAALGPAYRRQPRIHRPGPVEYRGGLLLRLYLLRLAQPFGAQFRGRRAHAAGERVLGAVAGGAGRGQRAAAGADPDGGDRGDAAAGGVGPARHRAAAPHLHAQPYRVRDRHRHLCRHAGDPARNGSAARHRAVAGGLPVPHLAARRAQPGAGCRRPRPALHAAGRAAPAAAGMPTAQAAAHGGCDLLRRGAIRDRPPALAAHRQCRPDPPAGDDQEHEFHRPRRRGNVGIRTERAPRARRRPVLPPSPHAGTADLGPDRLYRQARRRPCVSDQAAGAAHHHRSAVAGSLRPLHGAHLRGMRVAARRHGGAGGIRAAVNGAPAQARFATLTAAKKEKRKKLGTAWAGGAGWQARPDGLCSVT